MRTRAFLGGTLLMAVALAGCKPTPKSDPAARRDDTAYLTAVNPTSPPVRPSPDFFASATVSQDGGKIEICHPHRATVQDHSDGQPHQLHRLRPGEVLASSNTAFRLLAYGIAMSTRSYGETPAGIPLTMFSPEGRALTEQEVNALGLQPWLQSYSSSGADFPFLQLFLGETNRPPLRFRAIGIFDARTRKSLSSGHSTRDVSRQYPGEAGFEVQAWHATPLEVVLDVELDGEVERELSATPDTHHEVPGGTVFFAGIRDGNANSVGNRTVTNTEVTTIKLSAASGSTKSSALFLTDPPNYAVRIGLLDAAGKSIADAGGMTSGRVRVVNLKKPAAEVERIRLSFSTNHHRVVLSIPPLAGLPTVRDLFEVRIPHANIKDEYELRSLVSHVTQMSFLGLPANQFPTGYFPRRYTDVTPDDLLKECGRVLGPSRIIVIDRERQEIRVEPPAWWNAWLWTKKKLGLK